MIWIGFQEGKEIIVAIQKQLEGEFEKIDYMRALDADKLSLSLDQAKERLEERKEVYSLFGAD